MYKNQKEIDRVMEEMQQVSAESVFFSFLTDDNYAVQMEMCIPVKVIQNTSENLKNWDGEKSDVLK